MKNKIGVQRSFFYRIVLPSILGAILIYLAVSNDFDKNPWVVSFLILIFFYPGYWLIQWGNSCPNCNCWSANEIIGETLIDSSDYTRNFSESKTENNITTTENFRETTITNKYEVSHKCKFCDHRWNTTKTKRSTNKQRL